MKLALRLCAVAVALLALGELSALLACPMCKEAVDQSFGQETASMRNGLGSGFAFSIYLMLSVPYLLIGGFAFAIWRNIRRSDSSEKTDA
ncbi:MAG: hypothetical protein OXT69_02120 [Candidatus Poribacteria bacterium]|nr:hypothetical protein [Candidatus Poribacteria bacterium]